MTDTYRVSENNRTRCSDRSQYNRSNYVISRERNGRKVPEKGTRRKGRKRKSWHPVSNGAVTCFTRTSGLTDPASWHNSSGVTWCLSSPLPACQRTLRGTRRGSLPAPLFMASPGAAVHSDSVVSPRNTENGLCQSAGELPHYLRDGETRLAGSAKICATVFIRSLFSR